MSRFLSVAVKYLRELIIDVGGLFYYSLVLLFKINTGPIPVSFLSTFQRLMAASRSIL